MSAAMRAAGPSRRALLGGALAMGGLAVAVPRLASASEGADAALAFAGDALVVAGAQFWRHGPAGDAARLASPGAPARALASHPARPRRLVAALAGGGVARSDDGGRSWRAADRGLPAAPVDALTAAAGAPDTLYAAVAGDGLWRSEDAGGAWAFVMDRPWIEDAERDVRALASVDLATGMGGIWIYAGTDRGVTRVPDCFCRWQDVTAGDAMDALAAGTQPAPPAPLPEGQPVLALVSAPGAPQRLTAALPSGLWASRDGGVVWTPRAPERATALAVHPSNPDRIAAVTAGGVILSHDGGAAWAALPVR